MQSPPPGKPLKGGLPTAFICAESGAPEFTKKTSAFCNVATRSTARDFQKVRRPFLPSGRIRRRPPEKITSDCGFHPAHFFRSRLAPPQPCFRRPVGCRRQNNGNPRKLGKGCSLSDQRIMPSTVAPHLKCAEIPPHAGAPSLAEEIDNNAAVGPQSHTGACQHADNPRLVNATWRSKPYDQPRPR